MEWGNILALVIGGLIFLVPVAFIWFVNIGGIVAAVRDRAVVKESRKAPSSLTCSADSDCPPGYTCLKGRCIPEGT